MTQRELDDFDKTVEVKRKVMELEASQSITDGRESLENSTEMH